jgi:SAM-dependent methyltransferase
MVSDGPLTFPAMSLKDRLYRTFDLGSRAAWDEITNRLRDCRTVLDLGCGAASPLRYLPRPERLVGVDGHAPSVARSEAMGIHDEYLACDVRSLPFPTGSFDAVVMLDLLEHLTMADGEALLDRAERIARRRVIVFTPNGWLPQNEYGGNPLQRHQSGWSPADLARRGYLVRGVSGYKAFRGPHAAYRRPVLFVAPLASVSQLFVYRRPTKAFHLLAIKTLA